MVAKASQHMPPGPASEKNISNQRGLQEVQMGPPTRPEQAFSGRS